MFHSKFATALVVLGTVLAPAASYAGPPASSQPCILHQHQVTAVTPYRVDEPIGRASVSRLKGAQIFVQAEPGLTAEWLRLNLARHLAAMHGSSMPNCAFDVKDVKVQVDSAGTGFSVKITAPDNTRAEEVLRRARLLLG
jgi:hypothetical protein